MFGKIIVVILMIMMLLLGYVVYYNMPSDPESLSEKYSNKGDIYHIDYGDTPVFWEGLRFAESKISYFIDPSCPKTRVNLMLEAFSIFQNQVKLIEFYEDTYQESDIIVGCSNNFVEMGDNLFAAGEGGPDTILNTSNFKIIQSGKIMLFRKSNCDYPVVELHELLHVFGFDHSSNPNNIMFNISDCGQRMTPDMIELMRNLYAVPSKPDLIIDDITASKRGRYLDFEISINNEGLARADDVYLDLEIEGEVFETIDIGTLSIGYGRTITAENIMMPERDPEKIVFKVDRGNLVDEISEDNNHLTLVSSNS